MAAKKQKTPEQKQVGGWPSKRKFHLGLPITSVHELADWLVAGGWCYFGLNRSAPKHPRFIENMTFAVLVSAARSGHLHRAERNLEPLSALRGPETPKGASRTKKAYSVPPINSER